jgi:hypothetical protein
MEAAISCNFHCKRLAQHWEGYWPTADLEQMVVDVRQRLSATACAAWRRRWNDRGRR